MTNEKLFKSQQDYTRPCTNYFLVATDNLNVTISCVVVVSEFVPTFSKNKLSDIPKVVIK